MSLSRTLKEVLTRHADTYGGLSEQIELLESKVYACDKALNHLQSDEWKWLIEEFFPYERCRIHLERENIPPDDSVKQAIVQGQLNEIKELSRRCIDMERERDHAIKELNRARQKRAELAERRERK